MSVRPAEAIQATKNWLEKIVIGFNFCSVARRVWLQDKVAYKVCLSREVLAIIDELAAACKELEQHPEIETTLLILPHFADSFANYLTLVEGGEYLLEKMGYTGIFQLASFHPAYIFAGTTEADPSNYTNRSPFPMLHLLREDSIERALEHYDDPEGIPERNIELANSKTKDTWQALLQACYPTTR